MELTRIVAAVLLAVAMTGCNLSSEPDGAEKRSPVSATTTTSQDAAKGSTSTVVDGVAPGSDTGEVFMPADDPQMVFTGPLENSAGSLVVNYERPSPSQAPGIATLPSVGNLQWFLDTEDGCLAVDRSTFIEATGEGHEIAITPTPGGNISIGESIPLWIEGDWLIHDGCASGDPIIRQGK